MATPTKAPNAVSAQPGIGATTPATTSHVRLGKEGNRLLKQALALLRNTALDYNAKYIALAHLGLDLYLQPLFETHNPAEVLPLEIERLLPLKHGRDAVQAAQSDPAGMKRALSQLELGLSEADLAAVVASSSPEHELGKRYAEADARRFANQQGLMELNIEFAPAHFRSTIVELAANRRNARRPGDSRPPAIVIGPKSDWNGNFRRPKDLDKLTRAYRVHYYEVASDKEAADAIADAVRRDGPADVLVLSGHGTPQNLQWGNLRDDRSMLDASDRDLFEPVLSKAIRAGGHLVLESCQTGAGKTSAANMVNFVGTMAAQANIYGPTIDTGDSGLGFALNGTVEPGFGAAQTYHLPPR